MDLRPHVLAVGHAAAQLHAAKCSRREPQPDHGHIRVVQPRERGIDQPAHGGDFGDLVGEQVSRRIEFVDAHVDHDAAAHGRVEEPGRCRIRVVLAAVEEPRPPELAGGDPLARPNVFGVVPAHEAHLQAYASPRDHSEHGVRVGHRERKRFLAQDVAPGGGCGLDHGSMVHRRHRDQHGIHTWRRNRGLVVSKRRHAAELSAQAPAGLEVDVGDRGDFDFRHAPGDQPRVPAAHPPRANDRQAEACH